MKKVLTSMALALTVLGVGAVAVNNPVYADTAADIYLDETRPADVQGDNLTGTIQAIVNFVLGLIGILCVAVIIIGGVNYATSQGDTAKVQKGTRTILYGVVGLVVALLAYAIVNFVLTGIFG